MALIGVIEHTITQVGTVFLNYPYFVQRIAIVQAIAIIAHEERPSGLVTELTDLTLF